MLGPVNPLNSAGREVPLRREVPLKGTGNSFKNQAKELFLHLKMFALSRHDYEKIEKLDKKIDRLRVERGEVPEKGKDWEKLSKRLQDAVAERSRLGKPLSGASFKATVAAPKAQVQLEPIWQRLREAFAKGDQVITLAVADKLGKALLHAYGYPTREGIPHFLKDVKTNRIDEEDLLLILNHINSTYPEYEKEIATLMKEAQLWNKK